MPQFYLRNGRLYISDDNNHIFQLIKTNDRLKKYIVNPLTINGVTYARYNNFKSLDNTFIPITEQEIKNFRYVTPKPSKSSESPEKRKYYVRNGVTYVSDDDGKTAVAVTKSGYVNAHIPIDNSFTLVTDSSLKLNKSKINVTSSPGSSASTKTSPKRTQYLIPEGVKSRNDIIKIQQMLADANKAAGTNKYNLGTYGVNGNGVDGIWGAMTDAAYRDYLMDLERPVIVPDDTIGVLPIADVLRVRIAPRPVFLPMNWRDVYDDIKAGRRDSWIDYAKQGGSIIQKFKKIRKGQKGFLTSTLNKVKSGIDSELKKKNLSGVALLLHNLYEIGAFGNIDYDKAVDGTMGPRTRQALKKAKAMGYNFDEQVNNPITVKDNNPITVKDNSEHFTEIDPKDKKEFAEWLYLEGKDNFMGNSFDTIAAYFKSLSGLGSSINVGEGTKKLLVALHLLDNHNISKKKDGTIKHSIDKDKNGDYRWLLINGKLNVHNGRSIFAKAGGQPAEHIMGQYTMYETPDNYHVSDVYNFNDSGTDYSKRLIDSDGGSLYEYLRYFGGKYGSNKDIPVEIDIPKRLVLEWYNDFKSGKGVAQRAEKIKNEYNNKGYVGFGRQTYL